MEPVTECCAVCTGPHHALDCPDRPLRSRKPNERAHLATLAARKAEIEAERLSRLVALVAAVVAEDEARLRAEWTDAGRRTPWQHRQRDTHGCFRRGKVTV